MSSEIFVEKICEEAVLPFYAHEGDAGMDLCSIDEYTIAPGQTILVHTGLKFAIPQGLEVQIRPIFRYRYIFPECIRAASSVCPIEKVISDLYELDNIQTAFTDSISRKNEVVKAAIRID